MVQMRHDAYLRYRWSRRLCSYDFEDSVNEFNFDYNRYVIA